MSKPLPSFDPLKSEILRKINQDPCYEPTWTEILIMDSEPYYEPPSFTPPSSPRYYQPSLFDVE